MDNKAHMDDSFVFISSLKNNNCVNIPKPEQTIAVDDIKKNEDFLLVQKDLFNWDNHYINILKLD